MQNSTIPQRNALSSAVIVAVMSSASYATAQTTPKDTASSATVADIKGPKSSTTAASSSSSSIESIVVTARKREELLQDVPIAVTAFSATALEQQQVRNLEDLSLAAPNVYITKTQASSATAQIYIRGAGQDDTFANVEPAIGLYVDGVPYTKAIGSLLDLIEFRSIEVLRGPQGTLYGRNSTGGAIKFETRRPDRDKTRVLADATFGSFNRADFRGSYSTPLSDTVAAKIDLISRSDDGYVTDALATSLSGRSKKLNRTDRKAARIAFVWDATDRLKFFASADLSVDRSGIQTGVPFVSGTPADNINNANGTINRSAPLYGNRLAAPDITNPNAFDGRGTQINVTYDLDGFALSSILAYRSFKYDQGLDSNGGPAATGLRSQNGMPITRAIGNSIVRNWNNNTTTWELQASSTGADALKWTIGTFLMNESNKSTDFFGTFTTNVSGFRIDQTTKSGAIFGEASYSIVKDLEVSAGGRYTKDTKDFSRDHFAAFGLPLFSGAAYSGSTSVSWSQFTPRFTVSYRINENVSSYASYSKGFQAGAFQSVPFASAGSSNTPFQPTIVKNTEGGFKTQWLDNRITANVTVFRADYTDIPSTVLTAIDGFTVLTNGVRVAGTELELALRPVSGLSIYANLATLSDKYTKSVLAASFIPGAGERNRVKFAPDRTAKLGAQYEAKLAGGGKLSVGGNIAYSGEYFMNTVNTPFGVQKAYSVVDANIGYGSGNGRWKVTLAGKNLTDKLYASQATTGAGGAVWFGAPRTVSLAVLVTY